eukprot:Pompholyxophrys_punicea_v1_NODE_48_length_4459_cov_6.480699.p1 type:complete len:194 gc:universal NODE_48_length_4459_cov_6.480699:3124-2543(-)
MAEALTVHNKKLSDFGLPLPGPSRYATTTASRFQIHSNFMQGNPREIVLRNVPLLTSEQREIYDEVMTKILSGEHGSNNAFFVDSPRGCRKTFLLNTLLASVRLENKIALSVASSGIAALLLDGGVTAHSLFKIPLKLTANLTCNITLGTEITLLLQVHRRRNNRWSFHWNTCMDSSHFFDLFSKSNLELHGP